MNEFKNDLDIIIKTLGISIHDLARDLDFDVPTISSWLNGKYKPDNRSMQDVYEYAYKNGLKLNQAYETPFKELASKQGFITLFHGSKNGINSEINLSYSKPANDFGKGFYCGENLEQSSMFICDYPKSVVYAYGFYNKGLKKYEFEIDNDWMITIAYNRGLLNEYKDSRKLKKILTKSSDVDYIVAPIANNRMFDIIKEFTSGQISDESCRHGLAALDLGKQYVIKSAKAIDKIGLLKEFYLCNSERYFYKNEKINQQKQRYEKIKNFRSKYRNGKYIEELL